MTNQAYRSSVARVFAGLSDEPVFNGSLEHARVVVEEGFRAARKSVRLVTNRLDTVCYGEPDVLRAATDFLNRDDTNLEVIVEDERAFSDCAGVIDELKRAGGDRVLFRQVPHDVIGLYRYNMMLVDDTAYRFEQDRDEHLAVVAGGPANRDHMVKLEAAFDALRKLSPVKRPDRIPALA